MCGIVGCASTGKMSSRTERLDFMKMGLDIGSWRGWDSTGIALVTETAKEAPVVFKKAVNGRDFIQFRTVEKYLNDIEKYPVVIGHNRAATSNRGNLTDHNAHPFQYGRITLVHNGHIRNTHDLNQANQKADCQVDSSHVAWAMNDMGEERVLESVEGGFCFVWWNSELGTLNIARNNERPLHMAFAAKENSLYFASELTQLLHLMEANSITIDEDVGVLFPKPMVWHKFSLKDLREYTKVPFARRQGRQSSAITKIIGPIGKGTDSQPELTDEELSALELEDMPKGAEAGTSELDEIRQELSQKRGKDMNIHGVPTSPKRLKRAKMLLKKFGLDYMQMRSCIPKTWIKYKNQDNMGTIVATMRKDGHIVEILNCRFQEFEAAWSVKAILVEFVNVRKGDRNDDRLVGVISPRMEKFLKNREERMAKKEQEAQADHRASVSNSIDRVCPGPNGVLISMARFYELTTNGCCNCCRDILPQHCMDVVWIENSPVCTECASTPGIMELLGQSMSMGNVAGMH
jgi:predicted glutamine amidotransferase